MSRTAQLSLLEAIYLAIGVVESHSGDDFYGRVTVNFEAGVHRKGEVLVVTSGPDKQKIKTIIELAGGRSPDRPLAKTGVEVLDCRRSRRMSGERRG